MLDTPLKNIDGLSDKRIKMLEKLECHTIRDILFYLPRSYKDFSKITPCAALAVGDACAFVRISSEPSIYYPRKGLSIVNARGHDETGGVRLVWYNQPYRKKSIKPGQSYIVYGKVTGDSRQKTFENPDFEPIDSLADDSPIPRGILPIYPLVSGITQNTLRTATRACLLAGINHILEPIPAELRQDFSLCEINFALQNIHYPESWEALDFAKRRLSFSEMLYYMLSIERLSRQRKDKPGISFSCDSLLERFLKLLPFQPTASQMNCLKDIETDMNSVQMMNRLVQGDVGSGKTIIAMYALFVAVENGYQGVMMVPTEILAVQHYNTAISLFGEFYGISLLTGGLTEKQRTESLRKIAQGEIRLIIGTQALIQEDVRFAKLGLVVADEQHRFGVRQRAILSRDDHPDMLIMSATPIPRTMTLLLFGELDVSIIRELPPGRKPIKTSRVPAHKREDMYGYVCKQAQLGLQTYIICPLIEQSDVIDAISAEELYDELCKGALSGINIALLHGKMSSSEKDRIVSDFRSGKISALVSTTVIEVGVDVPNATIMIIESADRFGLAQMHQLRGRIGRGDKQSYCFLLGGQSDTANERLDILCSSSDGFEIAQKDLELRGPGEYLGTKQSGAGDFLFSGMIYDIVLVDEIKKMVSSLFDNPKYKDTCADLLQDAWSVYEKKTQDIALN